MTRYQVLTIVYSNYSIRVVPDKYIYNALQDAKLHIDKLIEAFVANGEDVEYKGIISSTNEIFDIYKEVKRGDYCEVYIYELETR